MKKRQTHQGAYCIITNEAGEYLLIKKSRGPYKGKFDLPGGKIEAGESDLDAVKREVWEETGAVLYKARFLKTLNITFDYIDDHEDFITFTHIGQIFEATEIDLESVEDKIFEDSNGIIWSNLASITKNNSSRLAYRALKNLHFTNNHDILSLK